MQTAPFRARVRACENPDLLVRGPGSWDPARVKGVWRLPVLSRSTGRARVRYGHRCKGLVGLGCRVVLRSRPGPGGF